MDSLLLIIGFVFMIIGVFGSFMPIPFGFIVGQFLDAFIGELLYNYKDHSRAFKAATGFFIGFLASSFMGFV